MAVGDFDTYYGDHPWIAIDKNQRQWYDPDLLSLFRLRALFTPAITFAKSLAAVSAKTMSVTQLLDPHPDTTALGLRQLWMPASHVDSRQVDITFSRYGGKVAYLEYDDIITYWRQNGRAGLRNILRGALGQHMVDTLDLLARNAFVGGALTSGFELYQGGGSDFSAIASTDTFDIKIAMDIWLGMASRGLPMALSPTGAGGSVVCFTSPGVIYDIQQSAASEEWVALPDYSNVDSLMRYEVGAYKNVRFVQSPKLILYNCGALIAQAPMDAARTAGDGAPDPSATLVDGTYRTGQSTAGITNNISLGTFGTGTIANLAVNDIITIHKTRSAAYGITNGVDFQEGTLMNRRIVSISDPVIVLDKPIMVDYDTDLGGGVYGYVTKATHCHASVFVGGRQGIVSGIGRPPRIHTPRPVDDFDQVNRFSWDGFIGYNTFAPELFEVVISAGSVRVKGNVVSQ